MTYTAPTFVDVPDPAHPPAGAPPLNAANMNALAGEVQRLSAAGNAAFIVAAPTGTAATDTVNIQAQLNAAATAGGGLVQLQAGTYVINATLVIDTGTILAGAGVYATTLRLAASTNADLLQTKNFATLTGGTTTGGPQLFGLHRLTLDGNRASNTSGWVARFYGKNYRVKEARFVNGASGGVWSEWAGLSAPGRGSQMETLWDDFRVANCAGTGLQWSGPNDSMLAQGIIDIDSSMPAGGNGVYVSSNGGGNPVFTGVHVWGAYNVGWYLDTQALLANCQSDGCLIGVMAGAQGVTVVGGAYYGTRGTTEEHGIQIGDATHSSVSGVTVDTFIYNLGANSYPVYAYSSGGQNRISATVRCDRTTGTWIGGTSSVADWYEVVGGGDSGRNVIQSPTQLTMRGGWYSYGPGTVQGNATQAMTWKNGATDILNVNASYGSLELVNASEIIGYKDAYTTKTLWLIPSTGAIQPGTAAGLGGHIYSGSGAPTISGTAGDFYLRTGTPTTANQRIYICTGGTAWTGIL